MARPDASETARAQLPAGARVACVASTYHRELVDRMLTSARETLEAAGLEPDAFEVVRAPGAFELPLVAQRLARRPDLDAVLAFGLVLRGATDHDRYIAQTVADALMRIGLEADKPVLFGLLTCNTLEQADERARPAREGGLDKGAEVARACALQLAALGAARRRPAPAGKAARSERA